MITVTTPSGTIMQATNGRAAWLTTRDAAPTPPVEPIAIEPAVQYVQKIKQSCDAETYRQFLDILSRYHHTTSDGIDEVQSHPASANTRGNQNFTLQAEVSRQIATLFKDAPELANDFRVFMPGRDQHLLDGPPIPLHGLDSKGRRKLDVVAESLSHSNSSGLPQKRKRKAGDKDREREKEAMPLRSGGTNGPASKVCSLLLLPCPSFTSGVETQARQPRRCRLQSKAHHRPDIFAPSRSITTRSNSGNHDACSYCCRRDQFL